MPLFRLLYKRSEKKYYVQMGLSRIFQGYRLHHLVHDLEIYNVQT